MRKFVLTLFLILPYLLMSQVLMSWNIQYLGESKFKKDTIVPQIGQVMIDSKADIIAIQELVTSRYGDSCIVQLSKILDYNYVISNRTTGRGSERYAYLYSKNIELIDSYLDTLLEDSLDREPFIGIFRYKCDTISIRQFHIVPTSKDPAHEIKLIKPNCDILCGDFNLGLTDNVYDSLKVYYNTPTNNSKTSLKRNGELNHPYDHFFTKKSLKVNYSSVYLYSYKWDRRKLSDHLPILIIL